MYILIHARNAQALNPRATDSCTQLVLDTRQPTPWNTRTTVCVEAAQASGIKDFKHMSVLLFEACDVCVYTV